MLSKYHVDIHRSTNETGSAPTPGTMKPRFDSDSGRSGPIQARAGWRRWQGRRRRAPGWHVIIVALGLAVTGCVEVEGGAVEFSWTLRNFEGNPIADDPAESCGLVRIDRIRLIWESPPDNGELVLGNDDFDCEANRGVTGFVVPAGSQLLRIIPICEGDMLPQVHTYEVPPPILRDVQSGEVVTLNSLLVVAEACGVQGANSDCTCASSATAQVGDNRSAITGQAP